MGINLNGLNSGLADTYSSLLSGASSSSTSDSGMNSLLTDYASIKNGSYGKMMKAYYKKAVAEETEGSDKSTKTASKKETQKDAAVASAAKAAYKDAEKLSSTDFSAEDMDGAYKAVSSFIDSYNSLVKSASKSSNESIQKQAEHLTNAMYNNFKLFGNIGITLNSDRTLSISKDSFKKANIGTVKALFSGAGSFADKVSSKASQIYRYASDGESVTAKSYTRTGSYSSTNTNTATIDSIT